MKKKVISIVVALAMTITSVCALQTVANAKEHNTKVYKVVNKNGYVYCVKNNKTIPNNIANTNMSHATSNKVTFSYNSNTKTLTFKGNGMIEGKEDNTKLPWYKYAKKAEKLVIKDGITGIGHFSFNNFTKLKTIVFPDEMNILGQECFKNCDSLINVVLPDDVDEYWGGTFSYCDNLKSIRIGDGDPMLYELGNFSRGTPKLEKITVSSGNTAFYSVDGVLYCRYTGWVDGPALLTYPAGKKNSTFKLPSNVTQIWSLAFSQAQYLENVILHDNLKLMDYCFEQCDKIKKLTIPKSVQFLIKDGSATTLSQVTDSPQNLKTIVNNSKYVSVELPNGHVTMDGSFVSYWKNKATDKYVKSIKNGTAVCVRHGMLTGIGQTFKVNGVTYEVTKFLSLGSNFFEGLSNKKPRANVKAIGYSQGFKLSDKVCYQNNYFKVTRKEVKKPTAIPKVNAKLYGYNDVKLSWQKIKNCYGYKVYYKKSSSSSYKLYKKTTTNSIKIPNLTSGTKYQFKVKPYITLNGKTYNGKLSDSSSIYTLKRISKPSVVKISSTKIRVYWNDINGESGYQIGRCATKNGNYIVAFSPKKDKYLSTLKYNSKTKYYKVRAYKIVNGNKIYAPWSEAGKVS